MSLLDALRRVGEGDFWRFQDRDSKGQWGRGGSSLPGAEKVVVNFDEPYIAASLYKGALKAFAARAEELARPSPLSGRIAARMKATVVGGILDGSVPWSARSLSKKDKAEILQRARDELDLTFSGPSGGPSGDITRPVDVAAQREVDKWLSERAVPDKPPATEYTRRVAYSAKLEVTIAQNEGEFGEGYLTSWADLTTEEAARFVAAARRAEGEPVAEDSPLTLDDYPVVQELSKWVAAGMPHPQRESLLVALRRIGGTK